MKKLLISFLILSSLSCSGVIETDIIVSKEINQKETTQEFKTTDGYTILGEKIEIPYTIDNLLKAFELLPTETKSQIDMSKIKATHYYVRFYPKNKKELDLLEEVKPRLMLSETPLDREIIVGGTSYRDPSLPDDVPTYQYTTIEVNRWRELMDTLSVEGEVLLEAYMPDYYVEGETKSHSNNQQNEIDELLKVAYEMTGHQYEPMTKASQWHPSGTIKAYDNIKNEFIPIKGVRVRGTRLLKIEEALTNEYGYYALGAFKNDVNMKVIWEGENWDIRDNGLLQATHDGPKTNSQWHLKININEDKQLAFSALHRAAYRCYIGNNKGLSRPANSRREKIVLNNVETFDDSEGLYSKQAFLGIGNDIKIAGLANSIFWNTPSILYNITCHELGHAIHCTHIKKKEYNDVEERVRETWATFIQYLYTRLEYRELGVEDKLCKIDSLKLMEEPDMRYNFQKRIDNPESQNYYNTYTPLFVDLVDDYNQLAYYKYQPTIHPDDNISNFPVHLIEGYLLNSQTFSELKAKLLNYANAYEDNPYGLTKDAVNNLFSVYNP